MKLMSWQRPLFHRSRVLFHRPSGRKAGYIDFKTLLGVGALAGMGWLWCFGREQPIHVVTRTMDGASLCVACAGTGKLRCSHCGGFGSVEVKAACPDCNGTGRHQWRLGKAEGPVARCPRCRGTGLATARRSCEQCSGTGVEACPSCAGTGRTKATVTTVCAGFSYWERFWKLFDIAPAENPPPQRKRNSAYPLIATYVEVKSTSKGKTVHVTHWGSVEQRGDTWVVPAVITWENEIDSVGRAVEFMVKNREVVGSRFVN